MSEEQLPGNKPQVEHSLITALHAVFSTHIPNSEAIYIPGDWHPPGFWVGLCAFARENGIHAESINFGYSRTAGYASAMGLKAALGGHDNYPYSRVNKGRTYSQLEHLSAPEVTDEANSRINSCIRQLFADTGHDKFVPDLCSVVGDIHDNVWSHGKHPAFQSRKNFPPEVDSILSSPWQTMGGAF